jgi:hypothetical protein
MGFRAKILRALRARRSATKQRAPELTKATIGHEQTISEVDLACAAQKLALNGTRALSAIEMLPTELVEQIASYLIDDYKPPREDDEISADFGPCVAFGGLLEFRKTSRLIQQKTGLLFARCFETHIVKFTEAIRSSHMRTHRLSYSVPDLRRSRHKLRLSTWSQQRTVHGCSHCLLTD